ncbi:PucR family transcriptional regulator [Actinomadura verrucosospora]|uniref:PucR family transcriptional regulator n=1 Tax=Actinomadura verrucosospora TaxID=46165 RepID=UPI0015630AB4|nr:PucR family transcriptional regulator [Actinomadura verrucosospora]
MTDSGLTVHDMAADAGLRLAVVAGRAGLGRRIRSAHVAELPDPTPWLRGGELLMTTGMRAGEAGGPAAFLRRLADAGVAAVALGLGSTLAYRRAPAAWTEPAEELGLPLLEVPEETPFIAVTDAVYRRLAELRYGDVEHALRAQRVLTGAAVRPGGVLAIARGLAAEAGLWVVVTDRAGRPLAAVPQDAAGRLGALGADLARVVRKGPHASARRTDGGDDVLFQPLGAGRLRGVLVCGADAELGAFQRMLIGSAVSLMSIELEHREALAGAERRRRAGLVRELVAGRHAPDAAAGVLASLGLGGGRVRVVVVPDVPDAAARLESFAEAFPGAAAAADASGLVAIMPEEDGLAKRLAAELPGLAAGMGGPVGPDGLELSLRQARQVLALERRSGPGVYDALARPNFQMLLGLGPPAVLRAYADAILGPIDRLPKGRGDELIRTLWAWIEADCSYERAADRLGIHRHTLRERLQRVERLTGKRLAARELGDVWMALAAREAADGAAAPAPEPGP